MSKLKVMYEGILDLANCKIPCYVLEDGTRVLSGRQMQTALKLTDDMQSSQSTGSRLQRYLNCFSHLSLDNGICPVQKHKLQYASYK